MSAEVLRRAAAQIREGQAQYTEGYEDRFELAVADWLDSVHINLDTYNATRPESLHAFAVARAYLGEPT